MAKSLRVSFVTGICLIFVGCASQKFLQVENQQDFQINEEFEEMVKVEEMSEGKPSVQSPPVRDQVRDQVEAKDPPLPSISKIEPKKSKEKKASIENEKKEVKSKPKKIDKKVVKMERRQPKIEDNEGFEGRRPVIDPFRVGEKVVMSVNYFKMSAGDLTFSVKPFVEVNGKKSYHFAIDIESSKMFSYFYAVEDHAETFVDFETLLPSTYKIDIKESKQLKDIRSFFDFNSLKATYWQKKVTKEKGEEKAKREWDILPYSQNVISALFYLRTFKLTKGKKLAFRVADAGKNIIFSGNVVRKEKLVTEVGEFDTVVVSPRFEIEGAFKQVGDIQIWLTDDDRKFPVRIESKIKIGTLIGAVKEIRP